MHAGLPPRGAVVNAAELWHRVTWSDDEVRILGPAAQLHDRKDAPLHSKCMQHKVQYKALGNTKHWALQSTGCPAVATTTGCCSATHHYGKESMQHRAATAAAELSSAPPTHRRTAHRIGRSVHWWAQSLTAMAANDASNSRAVASTSACSSSMRLLQTPRAVTAASRCCSLPNGGGPVRAQR